MQALRVLVIEDNDQNLYLTNFLLQKHGYEVIEARNGPQGITLATQHPPELILLDIQLPEMDGFAVLDELRRVQQLDQVPIVAVTSYAMAGDRGRILRAGCNGYIEKPIDPERFIGQIERYLGRGKPAKEETR